MKNQNRLTTDQAKFLRAFREKPVLLDKLMGHIAIDWRRMTRWMRRSFFRDALSAVTVEIRRVGWAELELMYKCALFWMERMRDDEKISVIPMKWCEVIFHEYDRALRRRWMMRRRGAKRKRAAGDETVNIIHPAARAQEDELIERLLR